jgi:hypothetical protein
MKSPSNQAQIDLKAQHLASGLDPSDLQNLATPTNYRKPTTIRGVSID